MVLPTMNLVLGVAISGLLLALIECVDSFGLGRPSLIRVVDHRHHRQRRPQPIGGQSTSSLQMGTINDKSSSTTTTKQQQQKRIIWIRHGQTYMNELIGGGGVAYGQPGFTDVFADDELPKYKDSPLSPKGVQQALELKQRLKALNGSDEVASLSLQEIQLVAVSPLTRALQTLELGLQDHLQALDIPVVALPYATERVYLISDHGKPRAELQLQYPWVDFDMHFRQKKADDPWHFVPTLGQEAAYKEWRPHGQGQVYACLGEPQDVFDRRMSQLYHWLGTQDAECIAVVCHAGVIEWMTSGDILANCEILVKKFCDLKPRTLWSADNCGFIGEAPTL